VDNARDIGPHQAHTVRAGIGDHLLFLGSAILVRFTETSGDDKASFDTFSNTVVDGLQYLSRRDGDDGQIHWPRHSAHCRIDGLTKNRLSAPIDGGHCARETLPEELPQQPMPPGVRTFRGSHHRNTARTYKSVKLAARAHISLLIVPEKMSQLTRLDKRIIHANAARYEAVLGEKESDMGRLDGKIAL